MRDLFATSVRESDTFVDAGQAALAAVLRIDGVVGAALDAHGADGEPELTLVNDWFDPERVVRYLVSGFRTDPIRTAALAGHTAIAARDLLAPRAVRELAAEYGCPDAQSRHVLVAPVRGVIGLVRAIALREPPASTRDAMSALGTHLALRLATLGFPSAGPAMTPRQREVASLVAGGYTNAAIARRLAISLNAIKKHVAVMLDDFGVANRAELAAIAGRAAAADPFDERRLAPGYRLIRRSPSRSRR